MLPEKMTIIDLKENGKFNFNDLSLEDNYVVLVKARDIIKFEELLCFSKTLGKPLVYGDKEYYTFDTAILENELHYDGISSDGKRVIPDWLIFYIEQEIKQKGGEFRALNCESVLNDIDKDVIEIIENLPLEFYGFPTMYEPKPKPFDITFSIKTIINEKNKRVLRMHLPTDDKEFYSVEPDYVHCKIDDFRLRFKDMTGPETAEIFNNLRKVCYSEKHMMKIPMEAGDILFMKNKYTFHGRLKYIPPATRIIHRIQVVCD